MAKRQSELVNRINIWDIFPGTGFFTSSIRLTNRYGHRMTEMDSGEIRSIDALSESAKDCVYFIGITGLQIIYMGVLDLIIN